MQQHILDNRIGALAVLYDLVEIALQHIRNLADLCPQLVVEVGSGKCLSQFINKIDRDRRKIVEDIERVLDLVRDAGGQLTERGELLRLDQAVLRSPQVLQRLRQFAGAGLNTLEQPYVFDSDRRLVGERRYQLDLLVGEGTHLLARQSQDADRNALCLLYT